LKILITGGKSAATLKLLKAFADDHILLADYGDMPSFSSAAYQMHSLGERNDDITAHNLLNNCLDEGVEMILPLHTFEIDAVSRSIVLFEEFGISVLLPEIGKLDQYLSAVKQPGDWAIYRDGMLLFSSNPSDEQATLGKEAGLNGVFYITTGPKGLEAVLFTIN
jgi:hypothetical protein